MIMKTFFAVLCLVFSVSASADNATCMNKLKEVGQRWLASRDTNAPGAGQYQEHARKALESQLGQYAEMYRITQESACAGTTTGASMRTDYESKLKEFMSKLVELNRQQGTSFSAAAYCREKMPWLPLNTCQ